MLSARYTSEPRKDNPRAGYTTMSAISAASDAPDTAAKADKNEDELQMPVVAENDYLLPQSSAAPSTPPYVDVIPDSSHGMSSCIK